MIFRVRTLLRILCGVVILGWLSTTLASAARRDPDKVRLTASDSPDPFSIPGQSSKLTAVAYVRKVAGLGSRESDEDDDDCDEDRGGRRDHQKTFSVELRWTVSSGGVAIRTISKSVTLNPPYTWVKLQLEGRKQKRKFAQIPMELLWDGLNSAGQLVQPGNYSYAAIALFYRTHRHGDNTLVLIDESDPVQGSVTVQSSRPAPPTLGVYPTTTNAPLLTFSGGKPANTAIVFDGVVRTPLSAATSWTTTQTLVEGSNVFVITARNQSGVDSLPVTARVTLDTIPPSPPAVSSAPDFTRNQTVPLTGTKPAGTGVLVNGVLLVPINGSTTWSVNVSLTEGANQLRIETIDAAGNMSLAAGSHQASVAAQKPVIRDLDVTPGEITAGQSTQITYRLFALNTPPTEGDLNVSVRIESGDLVVKELVTAVQRGTPAGPTFSVSWDGTDASGQPVPVNVSYRVTVSGTRATPTTAPPELADPNPKETAVLVTGSQHVSSADRRLQIVFRPDDARLTIDQFPELTARASRLLTSRALHPVGCYRVRIDRPFVGPAVGVLKCADVSGGLVRPFAWDELQQDWLPVSHANWNPRSKELSFRVPGASLIVFATTNDVEPPYVRDARLVGSHFTATIYDDGSGIDTRRLKLRRNGQDISAGLSTQLVNGVHTVQVTLDGVSSLQSLTLYAEDRAGRGRLLPLAERTAP